MNYFLVFLGGGLGSICRYWFGLKFSDASNGFPVATLCANVVSSFVLGVVFAFLITKGNENHFTKLLIATGFCGGFSTFSTFSNETIQLFVQGQISTGFLNIFANLFLAFLAILLGYFVGNQIIN